MKKVTLPKFPINGGCQCGKIRYSLKSPPVVFYLCHCTECQKQSSSAFGESVWVKVADVEMQGTPARFDRKTARGGVIACEYCPSCGSRLFHGRDPDDDEMSLKGGSLDDTTWLKPAGHIWTGSKQPWVQVPADDIAYERQPADYGDLIARWRDMIAK